MENKIQNTKERSEVDWRSRAVKPYPAASLETRVVHSGERMKQRQHRSVAIPIEQTAAYYFESTEQIIDFYEGRLPGIKYGRYGCPTQHAVEEKFADLENTEQSLVFPSGMSALTTTILALVKKGEHIVYTGDCYQNTRRFLKEILPTLGIQATEVPIEQTKNLCQFIQKNTVLFFSELPTNPFLRIINLKDITKTAKQNNLITLIDSTFATPINVQPINFGADLVLHSATKYLGGHHDLFAGIVAGKTEYITKIQQYRDVLGGILDPHTAYLLLRSLQTLALRMNSHNQNGLEIAQYLENHQLVERVWYPGCKTHPDYDLAKRQLSGYGGVITFTLKATEKQTSQFIDHLKIPYIATNFGGPQSLIEQHALLTFYKDRQTATKRGITGNLIRYSTGFENPNDVIQDFEDAFSKSGIAKNH